MPSEPLGDDPDRLLTVDELAAHLRRRPRTVRNWRYADRGPKVTHTAGRTLYRVGDVRDWLATENPPAGAAS